MTVCNMSIEAGARAGLIAPDDTTFGYLRGPPARAAAAPTGRPRVDYWRSLRTDDDATFDDEVVIDADALTPVRDLGHQPRPGAPRWRRRCPTRRRAPTRASGPPPSGRWPTWA